MEVEMRELIWHKEYIHIILYAWFLILVRLWRIDGWRIPVSTGKWSSSLLVDRLTFVEESVSLICCWDIQRITENIEQLSHCLCSASASPPIVRLHVPSLWSLVTGPWLRNHSQDSAGLKGGMLTNTPKQDQDPSKRMWTQHLSIN